MLAPPLPIARPPDPPAEKHEPLGAVMTLRDPLSQTTAPADIPALESQVAAARSGDPRRSDALKALADAEFGEGRGVLGPTGREWRRKAIAHYDQLAKESPSFSRVDEVRYYQALAYEENSDLTNSRRQYYELIKSSPQSKYIPHAYFAFGEMFFDEAKSGDPTKYELAKQAYIEVTKYPPSNNPLHATAKSRLAEIKSIQAGHP